MKMIQYEEHDQYEHQHTSERMITRLTLLLSYLAYLRATRQLPRPEVSTLRLLIVVVGLVLVVVALVAAGAADQIDNVLRHWPLIP